MNNDAASASIIDQVLESMFERLAARDDIDPNVIEQLRGLVASGGITKPDDVIAAIRAATAPKGSADASG